MNKIEQVARAIAESAHGEQDGWNAWVEEAAAAIEAMRVPTEGMSDEGAANNFGKPSYAAWQAMIDAALEGK